MLLNPLVETQVETFNLNSDFIECSNLVENMTTGPMSAYEQVVLDSEDEEMHDSKLVCLQRVMGQKILWNR